MIYGLKYRFSQLPPHEHSLAATQSRVWSLEA